MLWLVLDPNPSQPFLFLFYFFLKIMLFCWFLWDALVWSSSFGGLCLDLVGPMSVDEINSYPNVLLHLDLFAFLFCPFDNLMVYTIIM